MLTVLIASRLHKIIIVGQRSWAMPCHWLLKIFTLCAPQKHGIHARSRLLCNFNNDNDDNGWVGEGRRDAGEGEHAGDYGKKKWEIDWMVRFFLLFIHISHRHRINNNEFANIYCCSECVVQIKKFLGYFALALAAENTRTSQKWFWFLAVRFTLCSMNRVDDMLLYIVCRCSASWTVNIYTNDDDRFKFFEGAAQRETFPSSIFFSPILFIIRDCVTASPVRERRHVPW